jgi:hypothetical protein
MSAVVEGEGEEGQVGLFMKLVLEHFNCNSDVCFKPAVIREDDDTSIEGEGNQPEFVSHVNQEGYAVIPFPQVPCEHGYFSSDIKSTLSHLNSYIRSPVMSPFHPIWIFMIPDAWKVVHALYDVVAPILGHDCVLEPSFFAFLLKGGVEVVERADSTHGTDELKTYSGSNFGLPHRDYTYSESNDEDGTPKMLSVWVPLDDATLDNGCMYVVPKWCDKEFKSLGNKRVASRVSSGATAINFPLHSVRPLPAVGGSVCLWQGSLIHWGAACSPHSTDPPRASIAFTFMRKDVDQLGDFPPILRSDIADIASDGSVKMQLICRSLLMYNQWLFLNRTVPSDIVDQCV